jgi:hypothetical protein
LTLPTAEPTVAAMGSLGTAALILFIAIGAFYLFVP